MYGDAPRVTLTGVPGWLTQGEQDVLFSLAQAVPDAGVIVEIGGEYGGSASLFSLGAKEFVHIVTIDLFPGDLLDKHQSNLREAGFGGSLQIRGDSSDVVKHWRKNIPRKMAIQAMALDAVPRDGIDLLFVDGDHSINGSRADFENWSPFVKVGGMMAVHDCACATNPLPHHSHFDVTHSLSAWYWQNGADWKLVKSVDSLMVFERVK